MDQYQCRGKLLKNFQDHWSIRISPGKGMDQWLVHMNFPRNLYGPMALKVLWKFRSWPVLVHRLAVSQRPLTLILLQKYRDTNGRRIAIQIGGVYTTFCQEEGILLQKYAIEMGGVSRYFSKVLGSGVDSTLLNRVLFPVSAPKSRVRCRFVMSAEFPGVRSWESDAYPKDPSVLFLVRSPIPVVCFTTL